MQTIMIVEDDPVIREELAFLLENENYQVCTVTDFTTVPEQARSACPDLVLLDKFVWDILRGYSDSILQIFPDTV